ncbi:MAG: hypothetical protein H7287_04255, partial [Thermoleophilia bacterium]|nr:hypothetical protein [Thermoleophilia bacterium]
MHAPAQMTVAAAYDGPVDPALEQQLDEGAPETTHQRSGGGLEDVGAEAAAHAMLRLTADFPGLMERLRTARIVGGYAVPHRDDADAVRLARYGIEIDWTLRELVRLV